MRNFKNFFLAIVVIFVMSAPVAADWTPSKPINLWIGFGAGGETDTIGRVIAAEMERVTGWQVVAENKPGGGGVAMFTQIAVGPKDGSVIGLGVNMPILINLVKRGDKLPFNLDSFDYLATVSAAEKAIIAPSDAPFSTIPEMLAYAKKKGGLVMIAEPGPETAIFNILNKASGGVLRRLTSTSTGESMAYLKGGQAMVGYGGGTHLPYLEKGEIKLLAGINRNRLSYAPDVPSLIEEGYNVYIDPYFYIAGRAGMDPDAKAALIDAIDKTLNKEKVKKAVWNALKNNVQNLGPTGTKKMLVDGLEVVKVLFGK